jgi:hypothetical protein
MPSRLGDDIDDFCIKCKRLTNHSVVSLFEEKPAKVRCRTCYHDHDFRNEEPLPSKKDLKKAALFAEVLAAKGAGGVDLSIADLPLDDEEEELEDEAEAEAEGGESADDGEVPPVAAKKAAAKKAPAKKASKKAR